MCGIVGYIGKKEVVPVIIDGLRRLEYRQVVDFPALCGRLLSASYMPNEGHPNYDAMMEALRALFACNEQNGVVTLDYDTRIYFGQLTGATTASLQ